MSLFNRKNQDSKNPTENTEQTSTISQIKDILRKNKVHGIIILSDSKEGCYFMGGTIKNIIADIALAMEMDENFTELIRLALDVYGKSKEEQNAKSNTEEAGRSSEE